LSKKPKLRRLPPDRDESWDAFSVFLALRSWNSDMTTKLST